MTITREERSHAHDADRRISGLRQLITSQKHRIAELQASGRNAAGNITLLRDLDASLQLMLDKRIVAVRKLRRRGLL